MIRTLQDHGIHQGIDVYMECTVVDAAQGRRPRRRRRSATTASAGGSRCFAAKAVVLATGGIGRAFKITSNSWEYTGDGHALAYDAGAELMDMEFVQFHPTGMVWPPSVRGILVTEGVRGEGGVLRNKDGKRFMFDDIPENYRAQTADNEEEGWRYTQGDKNARRPPELLTRDHVARCIMREVREGRGSPHGGVFLDIAWIKARLPNAAEHIKKKLPEHVPPVQAARGHRHHQEPMEVGPTTHYMMGGIRVDGDTQMSTVPGLVRRRRVRRGAARREPARRQLALRSAGVRQARRRARRRLRGAARRAAHRCSACRCRGARGARAFRRARRRRRSVSGAGGAAGDDAGPRRHRAPRGRDRSAHSARFRS